MEPVSMYGMSAFSNLREISRTMSISFMTRRCRSRASLLGRAFAQKLGDIEVDEIGVMKDDRFDRTLHLVALVTVGGDDVHDFARDAVLVGERDAAKRMPHLLSKFSLNYFARRILIKLERFTHVGQERARDEIVPLNGDAAAEGFLEDIGDGDALPRAGIQMLDERHVDVTGQQGELNRAQFGEGPAFPAAAGGDRLAPHRRHLFAQRLVLDLPDAGKELRDFSDAIDGRFVCFHGGYLGFSRYF